jgi:predicted nucleotide-binding protein
MTPCRLNEKQEMLLRSIVPGLKDGTVQNEWSNIFTGGGKITGIVGLDREGRLWREHWAGNVTFADFEKFVKCGYFIKMPNGGYVLDDVLILEHFELSPDKPKDEMMTDPRKVFVVHGRNEELRRSLFSFLRAIDLVPTEWTEAIKNTGKSSPYIGEILETAFSQAQAIVVLMTPEDEARLHPEYHGVDEPVYETKFTLQARANVLFEAGMAMGRNPDRTVLVEVGKLRGFSDIVGRHTIRLNNEPEKRLELANRLATAGCKVNKDGTDWLKIGDFSVSNLESTASEWGKSGQLYWLCRDLINAIGILRNSSNVPTKALIHNQLHQCHHHSDKLHMTEMDIEIRLRKLRDEAEAQELSQEDWSPAKRQDISQHLESILNDVGTVSVARQRDFDPGTGV